MQGHASLPPLGSVSISSRHYILSSEYLSKTASPHSYDPNVAVILSSACVQPTTHRHVSIGQDSPEHALQRLPITVGGRFTIFASPLAIRQTSSGMEPTPTEPTLQQTPSTQTAPQQPAPNPATTSAPSDIRAAHASLHADLLRTTSSAQRAAHDALTTWARSASLLTWALRDTAALEHALPGAFDALAAALGERLEAAFVRLTERAVGDERERAGLSARVEGLRDEFEQRLATAQDALAASQTAHTATEHDLVNAKQRIATLETEVGEQSKHAERARAAEAWAVFLERALADSQKATWDMRRQREDEAQRRGAEDAERVIQEREEKGRREREEAENAQADDAARRAEREKEARGLQDADKDLAMYLRQRDNVKAERAREIAALEAQFADTLKREKAKTRRKHTAALARHEAEVQDLKAELGRLDDALEARRHDRERYEAEKAAHKQTAEWLETCRKQMEDQAKYWAKEHNTWNRVKAELERRLLSEREQAAAQKADLERRLHAQRQPSPSARDVQKAQHRYAYDLVWNLQHGTLSFSKIPWPVPLPPKSPAELTEGAIRMYLLDPCAGPGGAPKKRIRDALLIFHPDKFERFWSRMEERDREMVELGVDMVSKSLTSILAEVGR